MKLSTVTALCLSFLAAHKVAAQFGYDDAGPEYCPDGGDAYYKNCEGSLDKCAPCLGEAERACEKATGKSCSGCTTNHRDKCKSTAKKLCFSKSDCGDGYKCIGSECVYSPLFD